MMMPVVLLLILSMYAGMGSVDNPDGTLAFWASFCPLTSPVVMMVRLPYDVPLWQPLLSLAIPIYHRLPDECPRREDLSYRHPHVWQEAINA